MAEVSAPPVIPKALWRETLHVRRFAFLKVPILSAVGPTVLELSDTRCVVRIRLRRRTKNHLGSMYFAVLVAGADCAGGLIAMRKIERSGRKISLVFKDLNAEFLKRAEDDTFFTCEDGPAIGELVARTIATGERQETPVRVTATVPSKLGDTPVARFTMTLSLKEAASPPRQ